LVLRHRYWFETHIFMWRHRLIREIIWVNGLVPRIRDQWIKCVLITTTFHSSESASFNLHIWGIINVIRIVITVLINVDDQIIGINGSNIMSWYWFMLLGSFWFLIWYINGVWTILRIDNLCLYWFCTILWFQIFRYSMNFPFGILLNCRLWTLRDVFGIICMLWINWWILMSVLAISNSKLFLCTLSKNFRCILQAH